MSMHQVPPAAHRRGESPVDGARPVDVRRPRWRQSLSLGATALLLLPLAGCKLELVDPKGSVGEQEKQLILIALGVMLLVVIPVIVLTLVFAWRYRETNVQAKYSPKWSHSTAIEVVVWTIPVVIVVSLAVIIWKTTHALDPYKPLESDVKPVRVEVVALNWKWLFIYPDYQVATVNQLTLPVGTPVEFKLTAESLMNSFFIPQLGSMVYAMSGMQTKLHLIADHTGTYAGMSAAYSGPGFSDMHFDTTVVSHADFDQWVQAAQRAPHTLDEKTLALLEQPGTSVPVALYANVTPGLFDGIVGKYMGQGDMKGMAGMPGMSASAGRPRDARRLAGPALDDVLNVANCRVDTLASATPPLTVTE